jgi:hypothetical protein
MNENALEFAGLKIKEVYEEGGGEGEGEHVEVVYSLTDGLHLIYFAVYGYYDSYNGTEWSLEAVRVEPKEVTQTQYFPLKVK